MHAFDKDKKVCNLLSDLSKAVNTLNQNLWLFKANAYGFPFNAIKSSKSYLL